MKVEAKTKCPICKSNANLVSFHIKAGVVASNLIFECKNCNVTFQAEASQYRIDPKTQTVYFSGITTALDLVWSKNGKFNPSERD